MKKYIVVFSNLFKYIFGPIFCFHYIVAQQVYDDLDFLVLLALLPRQLPSCSQRDWSHMLHTVQYSVKDIDHVRVLSVGRSNNSKFIFAHA